MNEFGWMMEESNASQAQQRSVGGLAALHKSALKKLFGGNGLGGFVGPTSSHNPIVPEHKAGKKRARTAGEEPCSSNSTCLSGGDIASLRQELDSLKRRKALLAGEVEQLRSGCAGASEGNGASLHGGSITICTVADELEHVRSRALASASQTSSEGRKSHSVDSSRDDKWSDREYLHKYDDRDGVGLIVGRKRRRQDVSSSSAAAAVTPSAIGGDAKDEIDCAISEAIDAARWEVRARTLAEHMHTVRTQRRIAAAHRLAGVSAIPLGSRVDDENVLGVRIDVCKDGSFVARYHVFFDIVMIRLDDEQNSYCDGDGSDGNDSKQYFRTVFRLAQHTLPTPGVSPKPILCRHFGSDGMLPIDEDGDASQNKEAITNAVRRCIGDLSDACHSFIMRRDACVYLQRKESLNKRHEQPLSSDRIFKNVACNDSFDRISFDLYYLHPGRSITCTTGGKNERAGLSVQLIYDNQMTARPSSMRIKTLLSPSEKKISSEDEVEPSNKNDGGVFVDTYSDAATLIEELEEALLSDPLPFVFEQQFGGLLSKCAG